MCRKYSKMLQANDRLLRGVAKGEKEVERWGEQAILFICIRHTPHQFSLLITVTWGQNHFLLFWLLMLLLLDFGGQRGRESKGARKQKKNIKEMSIGSHYFILN